MEHYSPLRYPGGKGKISTFFKQVIKDNCLYDGIYVEPYAGGASIALTLLINQYVSRIIINDIDPAIYAFWHSVLYSTDHLCRLIKDTPVSIDEWKLQKKKQKETTEISLLELGFSTFYLNRTNRSGIIDAGVIGGLNQSGTWKINARYNKSELIKRIYRIAKHTDHISLYNIDACELVSNLKDTLPPNTLFYFDPPYYVKGKDLYINYYNDLEHIAIANQVNSLERQKWIITYDNVKYIRKLYTNYRQIKYSLAYTANKFTKGEEIMILSDNVFVSSLNSKTILVRHLT